MRGVAASGGRWQGASAEMPFEFPIRATHLGAAIGFLSVLHTWGQNLLHHPHVHCVIPVGGLSPNRTQWVHPRDRFFLPVKVLSRVFRGKFVVGLSLLVTHNVARALDRASRVAFAAPAASFKRRTDC